MKGKGAFEKKKREIESFITFGRDVFHLASVFQRDIVVLSARSFVWRCFPALCALSLQRLRLNLRPRHYVTRGNLSDSSPETTSWVLLKDCGSHMAFITYFNVHPVAIFEYLQLLCEEGEDIMRGHNQ